MANAEIIYRTTVDLIKNGTISDGEVIHTFQHWKSLGYVVRKGEKAVVKLPIWKQGTKKSEEGERAKSVMFIKTSAFFASSQVEAV